jgi:hypothetical protein
MKYFLLLLFVCNTTLIFAQKDCDFSEAFTDSIGSYKSTRDYIVYEKQFGNTENYIFFSLINDGGTPYLNVQWIQKSKDFIKAECLDPKSKMFIQLENGKIITLIHTNNESCGNLITSESDGKYARVTNGSFMFLKNTLEELEKSKIDFIRIKFTTSQQDYIFKSTIQSELTGTTTNPNAYFQNYLHCIVD